MIKPGDKNSLLHYILETRPSETFLQLKADTPDFNGRFDSIGLFFCPAAGAEGLFAVGRIRKATGEINPITYDYFDTLAEAEFYYRFQVK